MDTNTILKERGGNYGDFKDGAKIMQNLKYTVRSSPNYAALEPCMKEALDMIQHKIGRILNGDPEYKDSWVDIIGYAQLIVNHLEDKEKSPCKKGQVYHVKI